MAGENTVTTTFFANEKEAQAAIVRLEKKYADLENAIRKVSKRSREGTSDWDKQVSQLSQSILRTLGPLALAREAVQLLKAEYDDLINRQKEASQSVMGFAGAFWQARLNLGKDTTIRDSKELQETIDRISKNTGAMPDAVATTLSSVFSARGNMPAAQAAKTAEAVLKLIPNIPEAQEPLAGAVLDLQKIDPKASAESILGYLLQLGTESRVTDTRALAENVATASAAVMRGGGSAQAGGALVAALSQAMGDTEGRISGTASISLARQLKDAFPDLASFDERLKLVQEDEKARQAFLEGGRFGGRKIEKAHFEVKAADAIEALLAGNTEVAQNYRDSMARLPGLRGGGEIFEGMMAEQAGDVVQQTDLARRRGLAGAERMKIADTEGAQIADARKTLEDTLAAQGAFGLTRFQAGTRFDISTALPGADPYAAAARELETFLRSGATSLNPLRGPRSDEDAAKLAEQIALLRELSQQLQQLNENSKRTADNTTKKPARNPAVE